MNEARKTLHDFAADLIDHELDMCLCALLYVTPRIQENHILIGDIVCELVEQGLFENGG